jgi:hypothetical protein
MDVGNAKQPTTLREVGLALHRHDYPIVGIAPKGTLIPQKDAQGTPLPPDIADGKQPRGPLAKGFTRFATGQTWVEAERFIRKHPNWGAGIVTGAIVAADIDILHPEAAAEIQILATRTLGPAPVRIGRAPKRLLVYRSETPFRKLVTPTFSFPTNDARQRVEVLAAGQQFVAYAIHPGTGRAYVWQNGSPLDISAADLAVVTEEMVRAFLVEAAAIIVRHDGIVVGDKNLDSHRRPREAGARAETGGENLDSAEGAKLTPMAPAAQEYRARGWAPLPLPERGKSPEKSVGKGWQGFTATDDTPFPGNLGVLLGKPSNGLTDIDLDCAETVALADELLPPTPAMFGRKSKPRSHRLFVCDPCPEATIQFQDIAKGNDDKNMLVEIRSTGGQTMFPPSIHPDGEPVEWESDGEPVRIDATELHRKVGDLAGMCLLIRHWPEESGRYNASGALVGALLRWGRSEDEVERLLTLIEKHKGKTPRITPAKQVKRLAAKLASGKKVPGLKKLREILGRDVVDKVAEWMCPVARPDLPLIRIAAGDLPRLVNEAASALAKAGCGIYQHGNRLVRIVLDKIKTTAGEALVPRLSQIEAPYLMLKLAEAARWERWNAEAGEWVPANVPRDVVASYLALDGDWRLPRLLGVVTAPTLRPGGTVLDVPGYDEATGLFFDPMGVSFPPIAAMPTKEQARAALATLKHPLRDYKFVSNVDRAVALSGVLTAVARGAMPVAPLHGFSAPVMGSGKSKLVDYASVIATGELAAVTATGKREEELEKRLVASMLAGDRVIAIDNVEGALGGEFLCQCLTQPRLKPRVLGVSKNVEVPNVASFFATGNQLELLGDMTRRTLRGDIDPGVERPELTSFDFDPVEEAKNDRAKLVVAALTMIKARLICGPKESAKLGSYERWTLLVRDTLIWLGEADPVQAMEKVRESDPRLGKLRSVAAAWLAMVGTKLKTVHEIVGQAVGVCDERGADLFGKPSPELEQALASVATGDDNKISHDKLGWWLKKNKGRLVRLTPEGPLYRFVDDESTTRKRWGMEEVKQGSGDEEPAM